MIGRRDHKSCVFVFPGGEAGACGVIRGHPRMKLKQERGTAGNTYEEPK